MIQKVLLIVNENSKFADVENHCNKFAIDCLPVQNSNTFDIEIEFTSAIKFFRNHDYKWVDLNEVRIATDFSPKIILLEDGTYVQPNRTDGIWETDSKDHTKLYWKFNPLYSKPITKYTGNLNAKNVVQANSAVNFNKKFELLFSKKSAIEISRSSIPFAAITCFTDHCDFDSLENLKAQRSLFKSTAIKVTKGFFLNHFSKRAENASVENDKSELELWRSDGHELCYHSLSQSIKSEDESHLDFKKFVPPFSAIPVWIDHGYQPYNFSLFEKNKISSKDYEAILEEKEIKMLWNYIDSGTGTFGVLNQLNARHFTLEKFVQGNVSASRMAQAQALIKTIVFHFLNDEKVIGNYKTTAQNFKKLVYQRHIRSLPKFVHDFYILFTAIAGVLLTWNNSKSKTFKVAKYTPLFFTHTLYNKAFVFFQTVEMIDFEKSLSRENINTLIEECGIFIAHTYFSDSITYHSGKLLLINNEINPKIKANFDYLSLKIAEQKIWNPTVTELYDYLQQFENATFGINADGGIELQHSGTLCYRKVQ